MKKLTDYSGEFIPNLRLQDFSKDVLVNLLAEYARAFVAMDGFYHTYLSQRFSIEEAGRVGVEIWQKASALTSRRLRKLLNIQGNDVEAMMKWLQVDPGLCSGVYDYTMDLRSKNHGVLTITKCPTLEYFERQGDGRESIICQGEETILFKSCAKLFNPAIECTCLKIPPRKSKEEIPCQWEYKLAIT